MMKTFPRQIILGLAAFVLTACNLFSSPPTTPQPSLDVTQAFQTVEARLTQAVALTQQALQTQSIPPTETPLPQTETPTETPVVSPTDTGVPTVGVTPTLQCDQAAPGNPIDVTIPDDTELYPGQVFVKTWRLVNVGTCTWTSDYAAVWFSGEKMGETISVPLPVDVAPGESIDISVEMTAPLEPGSYQSNWKLRNAGGVIFGLGPGAGLPYYVRVEVVAQDTPTPTPTATATLLPTKTPVPTPSAQASGPATLILSDTLDLDTNLVNNGAGDDLRYTLAASPQLVLQNGATLALMGVARPSLQECQSAALSTDPLAVDTLPLGTYACYRTDAGRYGWLRITGYISDTRTLNLDIYTWATP